MNPITTFVLYIDYDEQFVEQVENGDTNPLANLTIRAGEYDLTGASESRYYLDEYLYFHFRKLLDAVGDVVRGEQKNLTLYSIPDEIILRPEEDVVYVSLLNPKGERKNDNVPESGVPVTKTAFVEGLIRAAEEFHDEIVTTNPELENSEQMKTLNGYIQTARQSISDFKKQD